MRLNGGKTLGHAGCRRRAAGRARLLAALHQPEKEQDQLEEQNGDDRQLEEMTARDGQLLDGEAVDIISVSSFSSTLAFQLARPNRAAVRWKRRAA